jgi:hypothetical protein
LKTDGEQAMKSLQEEVQARRGERTILENSPTGESQSNGLAERAVQAVSEHARVLRSALQNRLGAVVSCHHPLMAWLVEHAASCTSRFHVGSDGKTAYERVKGKKFNQEIVEFGERIMYRRGKKVGNKLDVKWEEGVYLGICWRTGGAKVGSAAGVVVAHALRRVPVESRWNPTLTLGVKGLPWEWLFKEGGGADVQVRWLTEDEKVVGVECRAEDETKAQRVRLYARDFEQHGFTEGCPGCRSLRRKSDKGWHAVNHSEACRTRIELAIVRSKEGEERKRKADDKYRDAKRAATGPTAEDSRQQPQTVGSSSSSGLKRGRDGAPDDADADRARDRPPEGGAKREHEGAQDEGAPLPERARLQGVDARVRARWCDMHDEEDEEQVSAIQADSHDMCDPDPMMLHEYHDELQYYDDHSGEPLDPGLVAKACQDEMRRFDHMQVYQHVPREEAHGKIVKVRWVHSNKGTPEEPAIKCRLVAMEFASGEHRDDLFAGTPPLFAIKILLSLVASSSSDSECLMILDVKCAFLYGFIKRDLYVELPPEDPRHGEGVVGKLVKSMYGTRDAPQIWQETVELKLASIGFTASALHPAIYMHFDKEIRVVVHVDDFLCKGSRKHLKWLHDELAKAYDLKVKVIGNDHDLDKEGTFLGRLIRWTSDGIEVEGDPKHADVLISEWGMGQANGVETPIVAQDSEDREEVRQPMGAEDARRYRRAVARFNYMAQDRCDIAADDQAVKRALRYLIRYPRCVSVMGFQKMPETLEIFSDSDWAGNTRTRKSTSGGVVKFGSHVLTHWCKTQATIALSSAEAELNAMVKATSSGIGIAAVLRELRAESRIVIYTDSVAAKGIVMRRGAGRVKHLSVKQLWVQEVVRNRDVCICKVPRDLNPADLLTHACTRQAQDAHLGRLSVEREHHLR